MVTSIERIRGAMSSGWPCWLVLGAILTVCACGNDDSRNSGRTPRATSDASSGSSSGGASGSSGQTTDQSGSGSGGSGVATASGRAASGVQGGGSGVGTPAASGTFVPVTPKRSCDEEKCTSDETCKEGPYGTYCVRPCPGQPCPKDTEPFCTRTGGLVCVSGS